MQGAAHASFKTFFKKSHSFFLRNIDGSVTFKKCGLREIYVGAVQIEKTMVAVAAFIATS